MKSAALKYAAAGWPVFPCSPNDKRPLVGESKKGAGDAGLYRATVDTDQVAKWWKRWPKAMIGVPTGAPIGAFVIDIDPKDGIPVDHILSAIAMVGGEPLPTAPTVCTPRGGRHIYLAMPEGIEIGNRANVISHVDVRGTGGYVIVPPSVRTGAQAKKDGCEGKAYTWLDGGGVETFLPPAPSEAIIRFVTEKHGGVAPSAAPRPSAPSRVSVDDDRIRKYALSALEAETRSVAQSAEGGRNDALNRAAFALGQLVGAGALSESVVIAALEDAAVACGLAKDDGIRSVRATLRSGLQDGIAAPRDLSEIARRPGVPSRSQPARSRPANERAEDANGGAGGGSDLDPDILSACAAEPQNDTGNARRLMGWFGDDMLNVREVGQHFWADTHWESEGGDQAFTRFAQMTAERIAFESDFQFPTKAEREAIEAGLELENRPDPQMQMDVVAGGEGPRYTKREQAIIREGREARARVFKRKGDRRKFSVSSGNTNRINGMLAQALPHLTVSPNDMDAAPLAINVRNGTLWLHSEIVQEEDPECPDPDATRYVKRKRWRVTLKPHNRADFMSKVMPVEYDPEAECPKWSAFMERFQPKETVREFLRMFHGYALTGLMGEQVFVYNYGLGANGKSTFMEALARLMGPYAQVLPAEAITGDMQRRGDQATPEFARLPGARMVRCAELPRGHGFRENTLKLLTGGEPILVRHLHARFFEFHPTFKAIGSGNDKPNIGGVDEGIWRRMKLVPWEVTIPAAERRPMAKVLAEFAAEGSGILNWLLAGLVDYLENGFFVPPEVQAATDSYRSDMDPVGEFTQACVVREPESTVTARHMYRAYVAWCHANSVKPYAEKTFAQIMVQKGFEKEMGRIRIYMNVRLENVPDDPEEQEDRYR